jgi:hypothetical protein
VGNSVPKINIRRRKINKKAKINLQECQDETEDASREKGTRDNSRAPFIVVGVISNKRLVDLKKIMKI